MYEVSDGINDPVGASLKIIFDAPAGSSAHFYRSVCLYIELKHLEAPWEEVPAKVREQVKEVAEYVAQHSSMQLVLVRNSHRGSEDS